MYVQDDYKPSDPELGYHLIEDIVFGTVMTALPMLDASHVPFMVDRMRGANGTLVFHLDRRNPQCDGLAKSKDALVSFIGPNAYISPSWYRSAPRVPTWYYVTVQVRGQVTVISDPGRLTEMVCELSTLMEPAASRWNIDQVTAYTARLINGIVGFEMDVADIQTQVRIGQQNTPEDRADVRAALASGDNYQRALAHWIADYQGDA